MQRRTMVYNHKAVRLCMKNITLYLRKFNKTLMNIYINLFFREFWCFSAFVAILFNITIFIPIHNFRKSI